MRPVRIETAAPVPDASTCNVVVVDDAPDLRMLVRLAVERERHLRVVGEGTTGIEAIELAAQYHPAIMLLDVSMPEMDGMTALPRVRAVSPVTRVVMFSGFDARGLAPMARQLGAAGYLDKSLPLNQLATRLGQIVDSADRAAALGEMANPDADDDSDVVSLAPRSDGGVQDVFNDHLERFPIGFDAATIAMASLTLTGTIVRSNLAFCELTGLDEQRLIGMPLADLGVDDERVDLRARVAEVACGEPATLPMDHRVTRPDGSARWSCTNIVAVEDSSGAPLYLFAQLSDVTERRAAEDALERSEARYRRSTRSSEVVEIF